MFGLLSIYSSNNRRRLLVVGALVTLGIALTDRATAPDVALGFLYLFPMMLLGGILSRWQIVASGVLCAVLQELYGYPAAPGIHIRISRMLFTAIGFVGTGLFVSEVVRNRRMVQESLQEVSTQAALRRDAENQLRALIESSPAAIVTVDSDGKIVLGNHAAQRLFGPGEQSLTGQLISSYLPSLDSAVRASTSRVFRTSLQCKGRRNNGEVFLAGVWFSRYMTASGQQLAAIVVDLSEDRRNWEELSFDHLLKSTRILMSGLAHEIRNLCGAALVIHRNLRRVSGLEENEDFRALGTLIQGLEKISELELKPAPESSGAAVHLPEVLDELRVLIEAMCLEGNVELRWHTDSNVPLVWADRYGLLQVFLNLFKNSYRAMLDSEAKILQVSASVENDSVVVRFEDTGTGIQHPENLFRPFQPGAVSSGLGLYVSQAILKGFGAEVAYEPRPRGCCFAVVLPLAPAPETALHA